MLTERRGYNIFHFYYYFEFIEVRVTSHLEIFNFFDFFDKNCLINNEILIYSGICRNFSDEKCQGRLL